MIWLERRAFTDAFKSWQSPGWAMTHREQPRASMAMILIAISLSLTSTGCLAQSSPLEDTAQTPMPSPALPTEDSFAQVTTVEVTPGQPGAYTFAVTVQSPDTGCDQYADWWEVLDQEGNLIFRRILAHSHVDEQPFRRTGGPVVTQPNQLVIVRAHMHPQGYGTQAMQGSAEAGFETVTLPEDFAADLVEAEPQPQGCNF